MLPHHWARCQVFSSVRRQRPAGPACRSSGTHYSYGTAEYGTIDLKSRSNRSNPALAAAGCGLAGWAALTPARSAQQGSQPGGIRAIVSVWRRELSNTLPILAPACQPSSPLTRASSLVQRYTCTYMCTHNSCTGVQEKYCSTGEVLEYWRSTGVLNVVRYCNVRSPSG